MDYEQCKAAVDTLAQRSRYSPRVALGEQTYPDTPVSVSANWVAADLLPEWVSLADRLCWLIKGLKDEMMATEPTNTLEHNLALDFCYELHQLERWLYELYEVAQEEKDVMVCLVDPFGYESTPMHLPDAVVYCHTHAGWWWSAHEQMERQAPA